MAKNDRETTKLQEMSRKSKMVQIKAQLTLWTFEIITWLILSKTVYLKKSKVRHEAY